MKMKNQKKIVSFTLLCAVSCGLVMIGNVKADSQQESKGLLDKIFPAAKPHKKEEEKCEAPQANMKEPKNPSQGQEPPRVFYDISKGFASVAEKALPSVVNIATTQIIEPKSNPDGSRFPGFPGNGGNSLEDYFREFLGPGLQNDTPKRVQSLGSGFVIKVDRDFVYIVTNHHVVAEAKKITIFFHDKTSVEAVTHASDERTDIAVLKVKIKELPEQNRHIQALEWADAEKAHIGDWVLAIGNPFGLGSSVTSGIISSKGRDLISSGRGKGGSYVDDFIQHSAQINMGNSGGCLLDMSGRVLGVNTAILSPSGGNVGVGFATPSDVARKTVDQLIEFGRTKRGWLGVRVQHLADESLEAIGLKGQGDMVMDVTPAGPADKAGMMAGDIVIEYNGKPINDSNRITRLVGETKAGDTVPVKIYRKNKGFMVLQVRVGEYEEAIKDDRFQKENDQKSSKSNQKALEILGMKVSKLSTEQQTAGKKGILIIERKPLGGAEEAGLLVGDIIQQVNQQDISDPEEFKKIIERAQNEGKKAVLLFVMREKEHINITLKISNDLEEDKKKSK